jgi:hypothetical protein
MGTFLANVCYISVELANLWNHFSSGSEQLQAWAAFSGDSLSQSTCKPDVQRWIRLLCLCLCSRTPALTSCTAFPSIFGIACLTPAVDAHSCAHRNPTYVSPRVFRAWENVELHLVYKRPVSRTDLFIVFNNFQLSLRCFCCSHFSPWLRISPV